jgi:3-hydroxybutyryl-CoA dehydratase
MYGYKNFDEINIGDSYSYSRTVTEMETYIAVGIIGAINPVHIDEEYCKKTQFKSRIGLALQYNTLAVNVAENFMVGPGSKLLEIDSTYIIPVYYGDTLTAKVKITGKNKEDTTVDFATEMLNQDNKTLLIGTFKLKVMEGE